MTMRIAPVAIFAISLTAACSSAPEAPPAARRTRAAAAAPDTKAAPAPSNKTPEVRADEILADLKRRQEQADGVAQRARDNVPVVTEVSPKRSAPTFSEIAQRSGGAGSGPGGPAAAADGNSNDANYWRQEFSIANAKLQSARQAMEQARTRMNEAASQANSQNAAVRRLGQDAYQRAQQEFSQAQNDHYQAQAAVDTARSAALRAGVPITYLR